MTQDKNFGIQSVAVIGSGAAGLTTLFELLHTKRDGSTTIRYHDNGDLDASKLENDQPAFTKIVAFEQSAKVGGIWAPSFENPDVIPQGMLETGQYNDPYILKPKTILPSGVKNGDYCFQKPFAVESESSSKNWTSSGIYKHLYSNVPSRYLRNSFIPYKEIKSKGPLTDFLDPLITNGEVTDRLLKFSQRFQLGQYIRLNSEVADIRKTSDGSKWEITVRRSSPDCSVAHWYTELFDAVIVSTGHYSVPYIPKIEGLSTWNKQCKSSLFHSKSFRDPEIFRDKVCLFVGTGLSGIDILQYAFPIAKRVIVSRSVGKEEIYKWLTNAANSDGIVVKPRIKKLLPAENRKVVFEDGTSILGVDYIVLSTGYHWHYPFLRGEDTGVSVVSKSGKTPDGSSMVSGLYLNSFAIADPTLAFVGVTVSSFKWPSFELAASAIAGVWTNNGKLPDKQEQMDSVKKKLEKTGQGIEYHYYSPTNFSEYVDEVAGYLPKGRMPSDIFDSKHLDDMLTSSATAEKLFYQLKNGRILASSTLEPFK